MTVVQRKQLHSLIDALPDSTLVEAQNWLQTFSRRRGSNGGSATPYAPMALGGLWAGEIIDEEDILTVRQEMTVSFLKGLE
ncbi:MAG TPA: hypothetical protein PK170_06410 [Anaerolineae bacterium]|nr:hypothetical protein [Anaerolineae bacterium]